MLTPPFLSPIAEDVDRVEALLRERLGSDVPLVRQVAEHTVSGGGKRLRPALLVLCARAAGYRGEAHVNLAAVVEFIHTATLLHDDVVDESRVRRGRDTANVAFGNSAAVLVGDFLYSRAFQMMVEAGSMKVMQVLADATNTIAQGEVLQLMACRNPDVSEAEYFQVVQRKTAKLFEAAAQMGGILAGASPEIEQGFASYGLHLGIAFQLIDDVLDYTGERETIGKALGNDLAEGKPTLPLIRSMQVGSPRQAGVVRRAILEGGPDGFEEVLEAMKACGALEYTRDVAVREAELAGRAVALLPPSRWKENLLELAGFSVTRRH